MHPKKIEDYSKDPMTQTYWALQQSRLTAEPKNKTMEKYKDQAIAKVTLVNGEDISCLSDSQIITRISEANAAIKSLEELDITSENINNKINTQKEVVVTLVDELDSSARLKYPD